MVVDVDENITFSANIRERPHDGKTHFFIY